MRCRGLLLIVLSIALAGGSQSPADETREASTDARRLAHFEKSIRPALIKYCFECHSRDGEINGGLSLDSRSGWEIGGDSGPAIIPGKPSESRLLKAIRYEDPKLQMPPDRRLPPEVVRDFEKWIADGAADPRTGTGSPKTASGNASADRLWSLQPLSSPRPPVIASGSSAVAPVDAFVVERLRSAGLKAAPAADRRTQLQRLALDLTGLPLSAAELDELVTAPDFDAAYLQLVDRLLASPAYGEAMARRWMDVVRYAESVTLRGLVFPNAWRYRDYLIEAYSEDRPFDQMVLEQIAGDRLDSESPTERWRQLVATSFLALGNTNFEEQDKQQLEMDYIDEQLEVIGQAFLGQTLGCARCHDHKFDPIPTRDYYALAGIMKSAVSMRHSNVSNWIDQPLPLKPADEQQFAQFEKQLESLKKEVAAKKKTLAAVTKKSEAKAATTGSATSPSPASTDKKDAPETESNDGADPKTLQEELKALEANQKSLEAHVDQRPRYLAVVEELPPRDLAIHVRGDVHNLGAVVPRGFLSAVTMGQPFPIAEGSSGRLEFARWIASSENPLTARVYANRVWSWLMGQGLVESVNNFGNTGTGCSHPELLDWLAGELIRGNWSTKHLVKSIVTSDAYRRAVVDPDSAQSAVDPQNQLYWRGQLRRRSAEELRDAMLLASGELDLTLGGSLIKAGTKADNNYQHGGSRRSIYQPVFRNSLPELFGSFDFASPNTSVGQRPRSTVATQVLTLFNEPWIHQRSRAVAARIVAESRIFDAETLSRAAFILCLQRQPSAEELAIALEGFSKVDSARYEAELERLVHSLFASIDFRFLR